MNFRRSQNRSGRWLQLLIHEEGGQVLPFVCVVMVAMLGMASFAIDVGHALYSSRQLQSVTDADALAAAEAMAQPTATIASINGSTSGNATGNGGVVATYSAATQGLNVRSNLPNVAVSSTMKCLSTLQAEGIACVGSVPYNAVQVTQTLSLPTFFGALIGVKSVPLTATSTAASRGGAPRATNVAVVIDTTLSMAEYDSNCTATQMQCALNGFQVLLNNLSPCGNYQTQCSASGLIQNPFDQVALFTFPNVSVGTAGYDSNCPATMGSDGTTYNGTYGYITMYPENAYPYIPTAVAYSFPSSTGTSYSPTGSTTATYQVTPFLADYRTSNSSTMLNPASRLVKAAGAVSNCNGMEPSNFDGEYGTYYAGAIYAAQAALTAQKAAYPGTENVMIILGDGDSHSPQMWNGNYPMPSPADASGNYPSYVDECHQEVVAANAATTAGTLVYTVAYGSSEVTGCALDTLNTTYLNNPCNAMAAMASASQMFYSDWKQTGSDGTCTSAQPVTSLNAIFSAIAADLTTARLIPNNTT